MQNWVSYSKLVILYMDLTKCKTLLKHIIIIFINSYRLNVKNKELSSADSSQWQSYFFVMRYL